MGSGLGGKGFSQGSRCELPCEAWGGNGTQVWGSRKKSGLEIEIRRSLAVGRIQKPPGCLRSARE